MQQAAAGIAFVAITTAPPAIIAVPRVAGARRCGLVPSPFSLEPSGAFDAGWRICPGVQSIAPRLLRRQLRCRRRFRRSGAVAECSTDRCGRTSWQLRPAADLNRDLSFGYGLPVDVATKAGGLAAVANALNDGALLRAQIATLHLRLPDLPRIDDGAHWHERRVALAKALRWSGLLKADWNPDKHPRLGGPPNAGWFAPIGMASDSVSLPTPVADFSGRYHGAVADDLMNDFKKSGIPAVKEVPIRIIGPNSSVVGYVDTIIQRPGKPLEVIEVETGADPPLTFNQAWYLPTLQVGGHIYSTDPRIQALGLKPGVPFPPAEVYVLFANPGDRVLVPIPPPVFVP